MVWLGSGEEKGEKKKRGKRVFAAGYQVNNSRAETRRRREERKKTLRMMLFLFCTITAREALP